MIFNTKFKHGIILLFLNIVICTVLDAQTPQAYIDSYSKLAVIEMKRSGVPASITMAQGMLESNNGSSSLAKQANNHFGIKCHKEWSGNTMHMDDDHANECFRSYPSVLESFADHSEFLRTRDRYAFLFDLSTTDYKGWAHGLKRAGYATDPNYANKLIKIIEDYQLNKLDVDIDPMSIETLDENFTKNKRRIDDFVINPGKIHEVKYNNGVKYIEVKSGDSFESIAKEFDLRSWELAHYNDLPERTKISDVQFLYIAAKRNKAHPDHQVHTIKNGETLQGISQKYGVKLKRLYKYNNLATGADVKAGEKVKLRSRK